jgi:nucleoside-diphosphate-sugar epimerase
MTTPPNASPALAVLVLGGTSWLGGAVARHAHARGHAVSCLARGSSGSVPDGVELVTADRDDLSAYDAVTGRDWDFVVDVARQPLHVRGAVEALASRARHWVFVSTCSVYADDDTPGQDESGPLHPAWSGEGLAPEEEYGPAKVACEQAVLERFPDALVARAGLIVGYGDRSDRFGYWPGRFARAGDDDGVLVPPLDAWCQVIDVEDLAAWLVSCGESGRGGVANAMGEPVRLRDTLGACAEASGSRARPVEAADSWLQEQGVEPWMGAESLPLWLPGPGYAGFMNRSTEAARRSGLTTRPLIESARAALTWERERGLDRSRRAGLSTERERALLSTLGSASG